MEGENAVTLLCLDVSGAADYIVLLIHSPASFIISVWLLKDTDNI